VLYKHIVEVEVGHSLIDGRAIVTGVRLLLIFIINECTSTS
jgi:hypothetical protein